jgi:hypothetical protein
MKRTCPFCAEWPPASASFFARERAPATAHTASLVRPRQCDRCRADAKANSGKQVSDGFAPASPPDPSGIRGSPQAKNPGLEDPSKDKAALKTDSKLGWPESAPKQPPPSLSSSGTNTPSSTDNDNDDDDKEDDKAAAKDQQAGSASAPKPSAQGVSAPSTQPPPPGPSSASKTPPGGVIPAVGKDGSSENGDDGSDRNYHYATPGGAPEAASGHKGSGSAPPPSPGAQGSTGDGLGVTGHTHLTHRAHPHTPPPPPAARRLLSQSAA